MKASSFARGFLPGLPPRSTTPVTHVKERCEPTSPEVSQHAWGAASWGTTCGSPPPGRVARHNGTALRTPRRSALPRAPIPVTFKQGKRGKCQCSLAAHRGLLSFVQTVQWAAISSPRRRRKAVALRARPTGHCASAPAPPEYPPQSASSSLPSPSGQIPSPPCLANRQDSTLNYRQLHDIICGVDRLPSSCPLWL
jgi:hypothetical protein